MWNSKLCSDIGEQTLSVHPKISQTVPRKVWWSLLGRVALGLKISQGISQNYFFHWFWLTKLTLVVFNWCSGVSLILMGFQWFSNLDDPAHYQLFDAKIVVPRVWYTAVWWFRKPPRTRTSLKNKSGRYDFWVYPRLAWNNGKQQPSRKMIEPLTLPALVQRGHSNQKLQVRKKKTLRLNFQPIDVGLCKTL